MSGVLVTPGAKTLAQIRQLQEEYDYVFITHDDQVNLPADKPKGLYHVTDGWAFRITHQAYLENNDLIRYTL